MSHAPANPWLAAGGCLSALAALLHLAVIVGGPNWYRFFGAGERMARAAEKGHLYPVIVTLGIAAMLLVWAAYAFSGAGLIARLPLLRTGLFAISAIYLVRGLVAVPLVIAAKGHAGPFWLWSSAIVLVYGIVHGIGTWQAWPGLSGEG